MCREVLFLGWRHVGRDRGQRFERVARVFLILRIALACASDHVAKLRWLGADQLAHHHVVDELFRVRESIRVLKGYHEFTESLGFVFGNGVPVPLAEVVRPVL